MKPDAETPERNLFVKDAAVFKKYLANAYRLQTETRRTIKKKVLNSSQST